MIRARRRPFICAIHQPLFLRQERFFICVKEWVKYLLILEGRGVEISQRQGERWSRSVQVFLICASRSTPLTRRSQTRRMNPSKRGNLSTICTGRNVATSPQRHRVARSTTTERRSLELRHARQSNELPSGQTTTLGFSASVCCLPSRRSCFASVIFAREAKSPPLMWQSTMLWLFLLAQKFRVGMSTPINVPV